MPKYYPFAVCGYYLYFTSKCVVEAFHIHASNKSLTEKGSAKFYVYENGDTKVEKKGRLKGSTIKEIQAFIKVYHEEMFETWKNAGGKSDYYKKR